MMAAFIGGLFVGAIIGVVIMALCVAARTDDDEQKPAQIEFPPITCEGLAGTCSHGVRWDRPCTWCDRGAE